MLNLTLNTWHVTLNLWLVPFELSLLTCNSFFLLLNLELCLLNFNSGLSLLTNHSLDVTIKMSPLTNHSWLTVPNKQLLIGYCWHVTLELPYLKSITQTELFVCPFWCATFCMFLLVSHSWHATPIKIKIWVFSTKSIAKIVGIPNIVSDVFLCKYPLCFLL